MSRRFGGIKLGKWGNRALAAAVIALAIVFPLFFPKAAAGSTT